VPQQVEPPPDSIPVEKNGHITYHLAPAGHWATQQANAHYLPERFNDDGFIHCTDTVDEVIAVGNRYYQADGRPYVLLEIDCAAVSAPMVYEDAGRLFPHIYGPLETGAVRNAREVERSADGRFVGIADLS
jgi:uncharacterized protein (DUF952 family)